MALSRPLAAFAAASFALVALSTTAYAGGELKSGDPRATVHDKNVTTCEAAGLPGKTIASGQIKAEADDVYIDVLDHTGITAVVVKGGDAYNVYLASALSEGWTDLHSPLNPNGKPAGISHWFACGELTGEQPPTEEVPPTKEQPPTETVTSTPSSSATTPATSVTTSPAAPAGAEELASTGFGSAWLLGVGAALVAAGAAVLLVLRRRRA
ncbi:LPXTG cell wall anchor domain-containing protein [Lentzea sp. NPDC005914]|uniref:LPXTG cell wall anchor domain-containing protein n=1 Tax=Lentzea sp. NPDC005914 TaxID=3154572 RepID=UPI0033E766A2